MATEQEKQEFIKKVWDAIKFQNLGGLFPSVLIAQAALESGWGLSGLAAKYNNLFGIKTTKDWTGKSVNLSTKEVINNQLQYIVSNFRVYDSWADSIKDRNKFLQDNPRYTKAGVFTATTADEQARALQAAGYATATNYANSLISTMKANNLYQYDVKKKELK